MKNRDDWVETVILSVGALLLILGVLAAVSKIQSWESRLDALEQHQQK